MQNPANTDFPVFTRREPAPEHELLSNELDKATPEPHARVLAMLEARIDGQVTSIPWDMIDQRSFGGLSFVGITASLVEPDGLFAQCGWFDSDDIDWFWVTITDVRSIELRQDPRFRGRTSCLWMTTGFAEYAMFLSHVTYEENWEHTLRHFRAPRCDIWPRKGLRPDWWPEQWAGSWPYDRSVPEHYAALVREDPLAQLAQNLSLDTGPSTSTWKRLGPKGDVQLPGRPANYLSQLTAWELAPDAGLRKTRRDNASIDEQDVDEGSGKGKGKRRRPEKERASKRKQMPGKQ